jgi:hypothetical protein
MYQVDSVSPHPKKLKKKTISGVDPGVLLEKVMKKNLLHTWN